VTLDGADPAVWGFYAHVTGSSEGLMCSEIFLRLEPLGAERVMAANCSELYPRVN
jgi:hypothetical protein